MYTYMYMYVSSMMHIRCRLTSEVRPVRRRHPQDVAVLDEVPGIEDVRDEEGGVAREVAKGNMCIASLLQLVLRNVTFWTMQLHVLICNHKSVNP